MPTLLPLVKSPPPHPAEVIKNISFRDIQNAHILFINMPLRETARPNTTPEGPLLLATNLRQNYGVRADIIDLNAYRIQDEESRRRGLPHGRHKTLSEAEALIHKYLAVHGEPDIIAFSGKITTIRWQRSLAKQIRQILPDVFLVTGGGLATETKENLFLYIPEIDGVAHSEGDDVIVKIVFDGLTIKQLGVETAVSSRKLEPYYLGYYRGRHRFLYAGDRPQNLDRFPYADLELLREDVEGNPVLEWYLKTPAWSRQANNSSAIPWNDDDVTPKTTSVSSRGCPFGCKYCFRKTQGERNWGVRSAQHIMRELQEHITRYGILFHGFPDDNFAVTLDRIKELNSLVMWGTHTRLDEVAGLNATTKGTAETMARAGCRYIGFGPESASAPILTALGKGGHTLTNGMQEVHIDGEVHEFPRSMILGIQNAVYNGIHSNCTWIFGSPTETLAHVKESVRFMRWQQEFYMSQGLPMDSVNTRMFTLTWYPGTTIINYEKVRQELTRVFGITFTPAPSKSVSWEPVYDDNFLNYMLELDDATKVLYGPDGQPLNFSDMPLDEFLEAREHIDAGQTLKILDMPS